MTDQETVDAFGAWACDMHCTLNARLSEMDETGGMDHLSDSGYWKTMCVAAWADKQIPDNVVGVALMERFWCLWRERQPPKSDELRAKIRELWDQNVPA